MNLLVQGVPYTLWKIVEPYLARVRPLDWFPGWRFGAGESPRSWLYQLRLARWSYHKARGSHVPFKIKWYDSLWVRMYLGNDLSRCLYVGGTYEPNEFMFLSKVLHPSMTVIDVGANDGLYSLFAAKKVGPTGLVLALEPSSREFERLEANLRLNQVEIVRAEQVAASDRNGFATLKIAESEHSGQNTLGDFAYNIEQKGVEKVRLMTLDNICEYHNCSRVDVMKIDVEGGEFKVLLGAQNILRQHRPMILLELVEAALRAQGTSRKEVLDLLRSFGYRFFIFGPTGRPEAVQEVEVDGANIIAIPIEKEGLYLSGNND